jgi:glycosyltransferase involved in cell wall biosynthesis
MTTILFVINGLGTGGAERSLSEMLDGLESRGLKTVTASLHRRAEGVQDGIVARGYDVRFLPGSRARQIVALRRLIRSIRPDVVHTAIFEANVVGRFASVGTGVPVMTSLTNTSYDPVREQDPNMKAWKLGVVRIIDGWTGRRFTAHFHAITHAVRDAGVKELGIRPDRVTVIPRGRDPERLGHPSAERRLAARKSLGIVAEVPVVVTVGRQEFQKGQWHLLEAAPEVCRRHPGTKILVAGRSGGVSDRLMDVHRRLDLGADVRFLGYREDVPEVLAAADLFVFPSLFEGLGGALIEAMALGLPIVASDIPAIREVVEEGRNALLVPAGDPEQLAHAIDELLSNADRRHAFGAESRRIFEGRFTLDRSMEGMVALFERVAAIGRREAATEVVT